MKRVRVRSSSIASVGYHSGSHILELEFEGGRLYQYFDVPREVHYGLMGAESIGRFVNSHIKGKYQCLCLDET